MWRRTQIGGGRLAVTIATVVFVLASAGQAKAAPVTIDFESGAGSGEAITNQYGPPGTPAGPTFKKGTEAGFSGLNCAPPHLNNTEGAHSGSNAIILDGCQTGEFWPSAAFFSLGYSTNEVDYWVAFPGSRTYCGETLICEEVWTTAFNAQGSIVAQQQTLLGTQNSTTYKEVAVHTSEEEIAFVAIEMGSKTEPSGSATGVNLSIGTTDLLVDDLTYNPPLSPPESSFRLGANPSATSVVPGHQVSVKIPITWTNNPNPESSPVSLELSSAPSGITGSFSPNPSTTGTSTLTLSAEKSVEPGPTSVTVTGHVGGKEASVTIPLEVVAPFLVNPLGEAVLAPCTPRQVAVRVPAASNFTDPLTIDVRSYQSHAAITGISPGQVLGPDHATATVYQQNGEATATLTLAVAPGTEPAGAQLLAVKVSAPGYADQFATGSVAVEAGEVSKMVDAGSNYTPPSVSTPQVGVLGSKLTLQGAGFCPGTKVGIGDPNGPATPESIASDGTSLTFRVPRSAVTGPVKVIPPSGKPFEGPSVPVKSFRNTFGFSWANGDYGLRLNEEMIDELFGQDQTNINVFGWLIRKPEAYLFETMTNKHIPGGICFGMAFASQEFRDFPLELQTFPHTGGTDVWHLDSASKPSEPLLRYVTQRFSLQFSDQVIPIETGQLLGQAINAHAANEDLSNIEAELAKGRPVMIGLVHWAGISLEAHTVLAYDTEPLPEGKTAVDVANSNIPYSTKEEGEPSLHDASEFRNSRIIIDSNGHWWFEQLGWDGPDANLIIFRHDELPILNGQRPGLPNLFTAAVMVVFGSSGDSVTQISGDHGGTLFHGGQLAPASNWPKGVAPVPDFTSHREPLQLVSADPKTAGPMDATVRRGAKGGAMSMNLPGLQASIQVGTHKGQLDHVSVDPGGRFIAYQPGASTHYDATLLASPQAKGAHASAKAPSDLSDHLAEASATGGKSGAERLSFQGGRDLVLRHEGPSGKVSLKLAAFSHNGPIEVKLPTMLVRSGETLSVAPLRWGALGSTLIRVRAGKGRRGISRLVKGTPVGRVFATVRHATLFAGKGGGLNLKLRLRHPPAGAWISPAVTVLRAGHAVARTTPSQILGDGLRAHTVRLKLNRSLLKGRYALRVRLLEATPDGMIQGSRVVTRTLSAVAKP